MPSGVDVDTRVSGAPPPREAPLKTEMSIIGESKGDGSNLSEDMKLGASATEDSVEIVLNEMGATKIVERRSSPDQNVFRHPQAVRPRAMHAPQMAGPPHPPPHPHYPYGHHGSGSWGYGPPPPDAYRGYPPPHPHAPYPMPHYPTSSSSFDEQGSYHQHTPHYSPHIQYPGPRYPGVDEVNVISPNHKGDPHYRPPITPRPRSAAPYYHYPPTSPVSRPGQGPPRLRNYAIRRGGHEGAYARAQRPDYEDGTWNAYGPPPPPPPPPAPTSSTRGNKTASRSQPPVVADSFDSAPQPPKSASSSSKPPPAPQSSDPHMQFYGGGGSWGSFDSAAAGPPPHFDDQRYYGFPPDSPYTPYPQPFASPGGLYQADSFSSPHTGYGPPPLPSNFSYSYDDEDRLLQDYHPDHDGDQKYVTPPGASAKKNRSKSSTPISSNINRNSLLPKAAEEIDFEVADPPLEPIIPESDTEPSCESLAEVNSYDVLCGRGGGTNSQIGNRRFRQLVQDFQPIYLMAKRKEKPMLARTIVLIIRKRGGRFLKKNEETGELFEVGDVKAEAKTSQALREGLDVRATKSASSTSAKKDKKSPTGSPKSSKDSETSRRPESPPPLPRLQGEEVVIGQVPPHSPEPNQIRKRRRIRSAERFFNDFMPPRADINNRGEDALADDEEEDDDINTTPIRRNGTREEDYQDCGGVVGCAGIALDIVTGAAKGSFCLGPAGWHR